MDTITFNNLNVSKNVVDREIHLTNWQIFDNLVFNLPSDFTFGKTFAFANIKPSKEKFTKMFAEKYSLIQLKDIESIDDLVSDNDVLYLKNGCITPKQLLNFLRNALAHRNIILIDEKMILFHFNSKSNKPNIDNVWNLELDILLCVESLDRFTDLLNFYNSLTYL